MKLYAFIEAEKDEQRNVERACDLLEVSSSAFYQWTKHISCKREISEAELLDRVAIHKESRGTYGSPRIHKQLKADGLTAGENRVARLMQRNGIVGGAKRRFKTTTVPDPDTIPTAVGLVKRAFGPDTVEINQLWGGDVSFIRTWEGWLYLASVIYVASRRVVGWAMADHMRAELVCDALKMTIDLRRPGGTDLSFRPRLSVL